MATRTQNVTDADVKKGQIRRPVRTVLQLGLKSQYPAAQKPSLQWAFGSSRKETATFSDNGSRSGTIRLGKATMESLVSSRCIAVGEQLQIAPVEGGGFRLCRHGAATTGAAASASSRRASIDSVAHGVVDRTADLMQRQLAAVSKTAGFGPPATVAQARSPPALPALLPAPAGLPRIKRERSDVRSPSPRARKRTAGGPSTGAQAAESVSSSSNGDAQASRRCGSSSRRSLTGAALGRSQEMPAKNSRVEVQFGDYAYSGTVTSQNFDKMTFGVVLDWEAEVRHGSLLCNFSTVLFYNHGRHFSTAEETPFRLGMAGSQAWKTPVEFSARRRGAAPLGRWWIGRSHRRVCNTSGSSTSGSSRRSSRSGRSSRSSGITSSRSIWCRCCASCSYRRTHACNTAWLSRSLPT